MAQNRRGVLGFAARCARALPNFFWEECRINGLLPRSSFTGGPNALYFDIKVDWPIDQVMAGLPVPKHAIKSPVRVTTRQKKVPDLMFFQAYYVGVSAAALELLSEQSEPSLEAFPIVIVDRHNETIAGKYLFLNVLTFREALIIDETNSKFLDSPIPESDGSYTNRKLRIIDFTKLKLQKDEIRGAHIWHERFPDYGGQYQLFASDTLVNNARTRKLSGFSRAAPVQEV